MQTDIIAKVRKLLTLAGDRGATEAEAAAAAAAAQRLIERHHLDVAALDEAAAAEPPPVEPVEQAALDPEDRARARVRWRGTLASACAASQGCRVVWWGPRLMVVGVPSRAASVRYLYAYLSRAVEALAEGAAQGRGRAYAHAWRVGCAARLAERVRAEADTARTQARAETQATAYARGGEAAIVRVAAAIARDDDARERTDAYMRSMHLRAGRAAAAPRSASGYAAGRAAGDRVRLASGPALGAGHARLT
jgi:hypothetical protein